jgi:hypothetical protein
LVGYFSRRFVVGAMAGAVRGRSRSERDDRGSRPRQGYDVEGDAVDVDPPHLPR